MPIYPAANETVNSRVYTRVPDRPAFNSPATITQSSMIVAGYTFAQDFPVTSTTPIDFGTATAPLTLTIVATGVVVDIGDTCAVYSRSNSAGIRITGTITGYNAGTGLLTLGSISKSGSGIHSDLNVNFGPLTGRDALFSGAFTLGASPNNLQGRLTPFRFSNIDSSVLMTNSAATLGSDTISQVNSCNNLEYWGKSEDEPFIIYSTGSAINFSSASVAGTYFRAHNVFTLNTGYAGLLANVGTGSGDLNGWNGNSYKRITITNWRSRGSYLEGEGLYFGHTSAPYATIKELVVCQCHIMDKGRESFQIENCDKFLVYQVTSTFVGNCGLNGQNHNVQVNNSNGTIENCIFDGAPNLWNLFSHGITFRNCFFRWTNPNSTAGFIGSTDTQYFGTHFTNSRLNGNPILFESCVFLYDGGIGVTVGACTDVAEKFANVEFRNCIFSPSILSLYNDIRGGGFTNSLIGTISTNGNTTTTVTRPEYAHYNIYEHRKYGVTTSSFYYNRGMGYKSPAIGQLDICQVDRVYDINVALGTPFASVPLPTALSSVLQDGWEQIQTVSWVQGSYDRNTPGTYTVYGGITIPAGRRNSTTVEATANIIVT